MKAKIKDQCDQLTKALITDKAARTFLFHFLGALELMEETKDLSGKNIAEAMDRAMHYARYAEKSI